MTHEVIESDQMPKPLGHYSPVVRVGELLFLSAQTGVDQSTGRIPDGGIEAECRQAFVNIENALKASGSTLGHVVKTTVLYTDLDDLAVINKVFADVFPVSPPARTAAIVGLAGGRHISIEATAVLSRES